MLSIPMPFWLEEGGGEISDSSQSGCEAYYFKCNIPQNLIFHLQLAMKENASRAVLCTYCMRLFLSLFLL